MTFSSARVSPGHKKSFEENGVMDTFSLSFTGDVYLSRAIDGFWKIVDGISACKYFLKTFEGIQKLNYYNFFPNVC